ncbi:MAG: hypothetical protein HKN76_07885 [Saprospiraceae bacterium]|nr:hypothetical protein [Saprospiraceae bacterium]
MELPDKYQSLLLEALEDLMYKVSLDLAKMKGQPMTKERRNLTSKQKELERLQHLVLTRPVKKG